MFNTGSLTALSSINLAAHGYTVRALLLCDILFGSSLVFFVAVCFFIEMGSSCWSWPWTHYVATIGHQRLSFLPLPSEYSGYRYVPLCPDFYSFFNTGCFWSLPPYSLLLSVSPLKQSVSTSSSHNISLKDECILLKT